MEDDVPDEDGEQAGECAVGRRLSEVDESNERLR